MKKALILVCAVLMLLPFTACGRRAEEYSLGMSSVSCRKMEESDRSTVKVTAAAVVLDREGIIRRCAVDELAFTATPSGSPADLSTKTERGDQYIPSAEETGGAETTASWADQAKAFCNYVVGKKPSEIGGIAATDGKTTAIDGCDIIVTDLIRAVTDAAAAARQQKIGEGDELSLAMTAVRDAAADSPQFEVELAAVTMEGDTLSGCAVDTLPISLPTESGAFTFVSGDILTKAQQKDGYGMKKASPIEREWYEQAEAFATYAVGKTAAELERVSTNAEGKTDAVAGCTVSITAMRKNLLRAAQR